MRRMIFCLIVTCLLSCNYSAYQEELKQAEKDLQGALLTIDSLEQKIENEGDLVHLVFLKVKTDANEAALLDELKKLASIEEVKDFQTGPFEDLKDDRALSEYNWIMEMSFENIETYKKFQDHPIHISLKESTKPFMAGPPATYDYMKR